MYRVIFRFLFPVRYTFTPFLFYLSSFSWQIKANFALDYEISSLIANSILRIILRFLNLSL
ncbi:hypothetical protein EVA_02978 [gut metagenome]|uniref:Uncharacterized protein n=1 Tax=gut metagenome TaxID=749906 RepID=J9H4X5_9ZZZZ